MKPSIITLLIFSVLGMGGCSGGKTTDTVDSPSAPSAMKRPATEPATPAVRVKVDLQIDAVVHLTVPPGTVAKLNSDLSAKFDPPVHPLGTIDSLKLYGKAIPLASKDLKEGLLTTVGFGDFEVFMTRDSGANLELRAFPADIEKLKNAYPAQATK